MPVGLKPWNKKIQAILNLQAPQNICQLRAFIGAINFYRDIWPHRAHLFTPLTNLTGKHKFTWEPHHQHAFDAIKAMIAEDALLH